MHLNTWIYIMCFLVTQWNPRQNFEPTQSYRESGRRRGQNRGDLLWLNITLHLYNVSARWAFYAWYSVKELVKLVSILIKRMPEFICMNLTNLFEQSTFSRYVLKALSACAVKPTSLFYILHLNKYFCHTNTPNSHTIRCSKSTSSYLNLKNT